jgi:uncharacterized HAD superfamily protein
MKNLPRLCVDIDNVVAQTDSVMRELIRRHTRDRVALKYADIIQFNYSECRDDRGNAISDSEWHEVHELFSREEVIHRLEPFDGVREHLVDLSRICELHFVTSRRRSAWASTAVWLERHSFPEHSLHFLARGKKHVCLSGFVAAIEDDREQAIAFARAGIPCVLLAHPWNELSEQVCRVFREPDWDGVVASVQKLVDSQQVDSV